MKNITILISAIVIALCLAGPAASKTGSDINAKVAQIGTGPADFNDVIAVFGQPSDYKWAGQSFKLADLPVERYWVWYPDSIHILMNWNHAIRLEIVDSAYVFNDKIPMSSSLESVLTIVGQPKETVVGQRGWEDGVLYKDINGQVGWCQYTRKDLNADFRFLNYQLKTVSIFLETKSPSRKRKSNNDTGGSRSFKTVRPIRSVKEFDDVRWKDMSRLDLSGRKGLIITLTFNRKTVWPASAKMSAGCDPNKVLTEAMNPGLGVRKLHKQGITGKGVNVAIIDQPLYLDHPEFAGKIAAYHDVGCGSNSSMHGPAVASLLVGTNCGTALDARVYYVAAPSWTKDTAYQAKALNWIIQQNKNLPASKKIRVASVSAAPSGPGSPFDKNQEMWDKACALAEAENILVLDCTRHHGFIGPCWYDASTPESVTRCTPGFPGRQGFWARPESILVPSSPRTTAEEYDKGNFGYQYCGRGGLSWAIPYCAGVLAMGWQVNPELSPDQMRELLFKSSYNKNGAKIINPKRFILLVRMAKVAPSQNQQQKHSRVQSETNTIVAGVRVGNYRLGMSKDDVLKSLGKPKMIFHSGERYTLDNLPRKYYMLFDDISFEIVDDSVQAIVVHSPFYKFTNGLGVGDSEQEFKQAFGLKFKFEEDQGKLYLTYKDEGLQFIIHKKNRTVMEFTVTKKISRGHEDSLVKPIKSVKEFDDVRWKDLSKLDLSDKKGLIATLRFNQKTVWPEQAKMPPGSDPNKILTDAMNPGLGVRKLHQQGITGKGVNVAIIDQPTYLVHPEFAGKIAAYHDTGCETDESSMHGPAVASLLVGTNCGTAPGTRVYYAAAPSWKRDAAYYAKGLDWIIAQNEKLPEGEKIRVVSVSASPNQSSWANRQMWDVACARAEADGIMVLDCTSSHRGFIGRCWYNARVPESVAQCNPWAPPNREFRFNPTDIGILVPSSPRTTAEDGDKGKFGYQYCGIGGLSWAIPYCAGVLAMGWQVNPELSPDQMQELLFKSAYTKKNGAKIINPRKFIYLVRKAKVTPRTSRSR